MKYAYVRQTSVPTSQAPQIRLSETWKVWIDELFHGGLQIRELSKNQIFKNVFNPRSKFEFIWLYLLLVLDNRIFI